MDLCNIKDYCGAALVSGRPSIIVNSSDSGYFSGFFVDPCGFSFLICCRPTNLTCRIQKRNRRGKIFPMIILP